MAKTFKDVNDKTVVIDLDETCLETDEDIVSGEVSNYYVIVNERKFVVQEQVYNAVKKLLKK